MFKEEFTAECFWCNVGERTERMETEEQFIKLLRSEGWGFTDNRFACPTCRGTEHENTNH